MGLAYLWDTNAVIYYFRKAFSLNGEKIVDDIVVKYQPCISIITEIELLCWKDLAIDEATILKNFIADCSVFDLDTHIKANTIEIRKNYSLKLPDAIIAATAVTYNLTLISNDKKGFGKVNALDILNPFD